MNEDSVEKRIMNMKSIKLMGGQLSFGSGALEEIGKVDAEKIFIVVGGRSAFQNQTMDKVEEILVSAGKDFMLCSGIPANPSTEVVLSGIDKMRSYKPDAVLAIGGGSAIDAAKVMALFYEYPKLNFELDFDTFLLPQVRKNISLIAVPTTSGTGTEVTKAAVITFKEKNIKIGLKSNAFVPDLAILDPELTLSMPPHVVAETGLDALTHAVECYINHNLDDFTEPIAMGAIEGLMTYLPLSYKENTLEYREKVHHYQCLAGMAFTNVGLGMAHGISHAFGGRYDYGHGLLNGIALPFVLKFNSRDEKVHAKLKRISARLGVNDIIDEISKLNEKLNMPKGFMSMGLSKETFEQDLDALVEDSLKGSTRSNPVQIKPAEMRALLIELMSK